MGLNRPHLTIVALAVTVGLLALQGPAADWPQFRGPNRDGVALASPKLADSWPTNGPALLWRSEWKERAFERRDGRDSGCGSPVIADGEVFVYATVKTPKDGGMLFKPFSKEVLMDAGWLPDLPDDLAKKIETARVARPRAGTKGNRDAPPWFAIIPPKDAEIDAYLAKHDDLAKYVANFVATLAPVDAAKYGAYIKRRFCMYNMDGYSHTGEYTWDELVALSKRQDRGFASVLDMGADGSEHTLGKGPRGLEQSFIMNAYLRASRIADTVVCMDEATGKTIWKQEFPVDLAIYNRGEIRWSPHGGFDYIGVCSAPTVSNGKVYVQGAMGIFCLSANDGALLWKAPTDPEHSSPLVADGVVYNAGVAYSAETGAVRWKDPGFKPNRKPWYAYAWCSPMLWSSGGTNYVIGYDGARHCALELKTGRRVWTIDQFSPGSMTPVVHDDLLIWGQTHNGGTDLVALRMTPAGVQPVWSRKDSGGTYCPLVYQDRVYCFGDCHGGRWRCVDLATGQDVWEQKVTHNDSITTAALVDGKIINACSNDSHGGAGGEDKIEMLKATPEGYVQLAVARLPAKFVGLSSPSVADGKLILRLQDGGVGCWDLINK